MLHDTQSQDHRPGPVKGSSRRSFGRIRKLPSGRWQVAYTGPDAHVYKAASTFDDEDTARAWLAAERKLIDLDEWLPPSQRGQRSKRRKVPLFGDYASSWIERRIVKGRALKPRTRAEYDRLLESVLSPDFGKLPLTAITRELVSVWWEGLPKTATQNARAYSLLRTILGGAIEDGYLAANPCHVRGAGNVTRAHKVTPLTISELAALVEAMPERHRLLVLLAAWCSLRFGELAELRRKDIDLTNMQIKVRRGVTRAGGEVHIDTPKSDAGSRDVAIPPHLRLAIADHLDRFAEPGRNGRVFPAAQGGTLAPSSVYGRAPTARRTPDGGKQYAGGWGFYRARVLAGHPTMHFHDLRHTGAVLAAQTGATLAELMNRLGHSTPGAALLYQHAAAARDAEIATRLSALATGGMV
ncbi:site-specific integrase [Propionimicrobium sp. PCR01-08-3]|uniref:tyrosine-type recombinase/integrase n=1 Tax=Propionimicrobium sp. PCR01-08-3 TaxID=3052086 RepID=UPI00255C5691|nr:site-specific integrase [Propionimicrobium sp. PCR01-08-3]WIY81394.1 site-specific integrase [Propionimicrobium sp. PCR01-08-3]